MSEIISRHQKPGRRMHNLKVDLTPMVDFGFLENPKELKEISYAEINQLRINAVQLKNKLVHRFGNDDKLVVMINPLKTASFNHVVVCWMK